MATSTATTKSLKAMKWSSLIPRSWVSYIFLYWVLLGNIALTYLIIRLLGRA